MRNISFALTTEQVRARTKTVTRRLGWSNLQRGELLQGCVKCQGLKKGEHPEKLGVIRVKSVRREMLNDVAYKDPVYGVAEMCKEGFLKMTPV